MRLASNQSKIRDILVERGEKLLAGPFNPVAFTGNEEADTLLNNLKHYPHAFVIACLMDRQWAAERCWLVPYRFQERLGSFAFNDLAPLSKEKVISLFIQSPPLHRLKERMAEILYLVIRRIEENYSGDAAQIWADKPSSEAIVRRFLEFKGSRVKNCNNGRKYSYSRVQDTG